MTFILNQSRLGASIGIAMQETPIEERGRTIQITWTQDGLDQDLELFGYSVRYFPAEGDSKESVGT
jgi:hypothetical protein